MTFNTPVLLIAWRRPHTTQQVINAIRAVKPTRMFVACDGPHPSRPEEAAKVMATWRMIDPKFHKLLWLFRVQGDKPRPMSMHSKGFSEFGKSRLYRLIRF
jgi:hypothetical protein